MALLFPPTNFACVEEGLFRSGMPTELNIPFLETLHLRTLLFLDHTDGSEHVWDPLLQTFLDDNDVRVLRIREEGGSLAAPHKPSQPISEAVVLDSLQYVGDSRCYPLLVVDLWGRHRNGVVIACLRKLQRWNLGSIFEEYRRFATGKRRLQNEQFVELFDTELVTVHENSPDFLTEFIPAPAPESEFHPPRPPGSIDGPSRIGDPPTTGASVVGTSSSATHT
mmetsp:Transcript_12068/g.34892  ORF Transcript_12068/g.34892 Transcript_12068/m.34892 type:complete len:223 (-) Transcript_12068:222-890(-)